jgi:hypothetical protein
MSRFGGVFWFVLVIASGMTNFLVKHTVQNLDEQLTRVRHQAVDEQKKIHELTADWTLLNRPELLADLNSRYVHLGPASVKQAANSLDDIPLRPVAPPPEAAPQIAEAAPAPPPTAAPPPVAAKAMIVPVSATTIAPPPIMPTAATTAPVRSQTASPAKPASLDGLFAQVTGGR